MNLLKRFLSILCILCIVFTVGCNQKSNENNEEFNNENNNGSEVTGYEMWQKVNQSDLSMTNSNFVYKVNYAGMGLKFKSNKIYGVTFKSNGEGSFYFNSSNGSLYNHTSSSKTDGISVDFNLGGYNLSENYTNITEYNGWKIMIKSNLRMAYCFLVDNKTVHNRTECINFNLAEGSLLRADAQTDDQKISLAKSILDCIEIQNNLSNIGIDYYYQDYINPIDLLGDQSITLQKTMEKDGDTIYFGISTSGQYISDDKISYVNSLRITGVDSKLTTKKLVYVYEYFLPDGIDLEKYKGNKMIYDGGEYIGNYTSKNGITFGVYRFKNANTTGENDKFYYKLTLNTTRNSYLVIYQNWGTSLLGYLGVTGEVEENVEYFSEIFTVNNR